MNTRSPVAELIEDTPYRTREDGTWDVCHFILACPSCGFEGASKESSEYPIPVDPPEHPSCEDDDECVVCEKWYDRWSMWAVLMDGHPWDEESCPQCWTPVRLWDWWSQVEEDRELDEAIRRLKEKVG